MSAERSALHPEPDEILASKAGILGILIWLPDFAGPRLARVSAGMFHDARHQMIYEVVQRLHSERKAADIAAVLESLKAANVLEAAGGAEYVKGMVDSAINGGAYMFERYVARLATGVSSPLSVVSSSAPSSQEQTEKAEDRLTKGNEGNEEGGICSEAAVLDHPEERSNLDKVTDQVGNKVSDKASEKGNSNHGAGERPAEGGIGENELSAGARILQELRALFLRFVVLPPHAAEMLPLWTLHTYAWELRRVTTYLAIVSPEKRCGKTTLLSLMQTVVKRPQLASNISPPSIFHAIEEMRPALLIDEFDSFLQGKDELRGILNAGYTRDSAYVLRASGQGQKLRRFSCWCPKVIAGIGRLPETLADRCIVMTMRRKTDEEQCERFDEYDGTELRDRCERWVEENRYEIERRRPSIPKELNDRAADIWEPLLVLADLAGGRWPELARRAAVGLSTSGVEQDMTGMLLNDIRIVFRVVGSEKLFSRTVVEALLMLPERPWKEARRGGQINELWLAQRLAPFGIRSGTVRLGEETAKGYCLADFADTFARYLPKVG